MPLIDRFDDESILSISYPGIVAGADACLAGSADQEHNLC